MPHTNTRLPAQPQVRQPWQIRAAPWLPGVALVLLSLIWGYSWVIAKQGLQFAGPFQFAADRCLGGGLALMLVLKLTGRSLRLPAARQTLLISLFQVTGFTALQTWALVEGGAGKTAVLIYTMPIWTLMLAWPCLGERIRGAQWLAALATLAGLVLIIAPWELQGSLLSKVLGLLSACCWAIGTVLVKRISHARPLDLLSVTAWQLMLGAIPLILLALLVPEQPTNWNLHFLGILAYIALASSAFGWLLWLFILSRAPAWEASLSVLGIPVVAIVSSRWITGEVFNLSEIFGMILIGAGLSLLSLFGWINARRIAAALGQAPAV